MDQLNKKVITKYIYKTNRTEEGSKESRGTRGEPRKDNNREAAANDSLEKAPAANDSLENRTN